MSELELQMLTAMRAQLAAMIMQIDFLLNVPRGSQAPDFDCAAGRHPVAGRTDASTMTMKQYQCGSCRQVVEMGAE